MASGPSAADSAAAKLDALLLIAPVTFETFDLDHPTLTRCEILVEQLEERKVAPIVELCAIGLEAIPPAAERLDDRRPTPILLGPARVPIRLGQLCAALICGRLANRTFGDPRGSHVSLSDFVQPNLGVFKPVVLEWVRWARTVSPRERLLHGLADPIQINQIYAAYDAGRYGLWAAVRPLEEMLYRILDDRAPVSASASGIALSAGVGSLADIGAVDALPVARRACEAVVGAENAAAPIATFKRMCDTAKAVGRLGGKDDALELLSGFDAKHGSALDAERRKILDDTVAAIRAGPDRSKVLRTALFGAVARAVVSSFPDRAESLLAWLIAIDSGGRPPREGVERARADLERALRAADPVRAEDHLVELDLLLRTPPRPSPEAGAGPVAAIRARMRRRDLAEARRWADAARDDLDLAAPLSARPAKLVR